MDVALLDTDIPSEFFKGQNAIVRRHADSYLKAHGQFAISAFSHFEVVRGFRFKRATAKLKAFEALCQGTHILPITNDILNQAANLWVAGRTGGHPHRDADLIIAATALVTGRTLITGNSSDFQWISGLTLGNWRMP
jgi:predicted nucleic acid-binding protein